MSKFNDIDMKHWKECDIWTDSLWLIEKRASDSLSDNSYHGNFVPQIPYQLIHRYTKEGDYILDPFMGSGTSIYEALKCNRKAFGIDLNQDCCHTVKEKLQEYSDYDEKYWCFNGDSTKKTVYNKIKKQLIQEGKENVQLAILHPPYHDIIHFSDKEEDLSNSKSVEEFITQFTKVVKHTKELLEKNRYIAIVIGDKYEKSEWIPLSSMCMNSCINMGLKLKSIIIKDMNNSRGKRNQNGIWRYRALTSDYYIFKHEYIYIFKNT